MFMVKLFLHIKKKLIQAPGTSMLSQRGAEKQMLRGIHGYLGSIPRHLIRDNHGDHHAPKLLSVTPELPNLFLSFNLSSQQQLHFGGGGGLHTRAPTSRVSIGLTTSAGSPLFIYLIGQTPLQSLECRGDIFPEVRHVSLKPFGIHYLYRDKKRKHTNDGHY